MQVVSRYTADLDIYCIDEAFLTVASAHRAGTRGDAGLGARDQGPPREPRRRARLRRRRSNTRTTAKLANKWAKRVAPFDGCAFGRTSLRRIGSS